MSAENIGSVKPESCIQKIMNQLSEQSKRPYSVPTTKELLDMRPSIPIHGSMAEKGLARRQPVVTVDLIRTGST